MADDPERRPAHRKETVPRGVIDVDHSLDRRVDVGDRGEESKDTRLEREAHEEAGKVGLVFGPDWAHGHRRSVPQDDRGFAMRRIGRGRAAIQHERATLTEPGR
jgi:hypothetical protein